jgi:hypothetical protein
MIDVENKKTTYVVKTGVVKTCVYKIKKMILKYGTNYES